MKFAELFRTSLQSLRANPRRSLLTMIGIIIGIAAVITIMSLGDGVKKRMYDLFSTDSSGSQKTEIQFVANDDSTGQITDGDVSGVKTGFSGRIKSVRIGRSGRQVSFSGEIGGRALSGFMSVLRKPAHPDMVAGHNLTRFQLESGDEAALISKKYAKDRFGSVKNALGSSVVIGTQSYTITGVYQPEEQWDADGKTTLLGADVLVPAKVYFKGLSGGDKLVLMFARGEKAAKTTEKVVKYLERHGECRRSGSYEYYDTGASLKQVSSMIDVLTYFVSAIAAISLFIAGIGVMNMMYISVSERTQEIGIRLAVGASPGDILLQFLLEAVMLTVTGGLLGFGLGWLIGTAISPFLPQKIHAVVTFRSFLMAFGVSSAVGVIFGILPARQAADKNLIDILR